MIAALGLSVIVRQRTLTSSPGTAIPLNIAGRLASLEVTAAATLGFESCTLPLRSAAPGEDARWASRLLCPITCYGPHAETIWDGYLARVEARQGGRTRSYSVETVANRVRTRFSTYLGSPAAIAPVSDDNSVALYGTHDSVLSLANMDADDALAYATAWLRRHALPEPVPATTIRSDGSVEPLEVTLYGAGWGTTLSWVVLERADTSKEASTDQVADLIGTTSPGIGAVNGFVSPAATEITAVGVSTTRKIEADTTYMAAIAQRLAFGDEDGERIAWGVYEGRRLRARQWAGATASAIAYRLQGDTLLNAAGARMPYWRARPDAMVEDADVAQPGPPSGAVASGGRFFVERTVFRVDESGQELTLEPEASSSVDARIARAST